MIGPYNRPFPSMGEGPQAVDPQMPQQPQGGSGMRAGWLDYLGQQGWDGQGMPWQYAQQLRQQGQHPRWDYMHPGQAWPGSGQNALQMPGLGGLGQFGGSSPNPQQGWNSGQGFPGAHGYEPPHPLPIPGMSLPNSGSYDGSGINPGGVFSQQGFAPAYNPSAPPIQPPGGLMDMAKRFKPGKFPQA